jgi:hypothetical protein
LIVLFRVNNTIGLYIHVAENMERLIEGFNVGMNEGFHISNNN